MYSPKISVIVPAYNHSEYILETLESVLVQSFKDFECIVINDGSTDATEKIVQDWIKRDERFKYYYQENAGLSNARNKGISLSSGKYILPLDSDDRISENYLEECAFIMDRNDEVKIVYGQGYFFGDENRRWNLDPYNFEDLLYKNMIFCSGLFRKNDWEAVGGYDENLKEGLEDWEFWINILKNGGEVKKISSCFFYYRKKEDSMITETLYKKNYGYDSRLYIFQKHIDLYNKSNFYDMYYENYKLRKCVKDPLYFLNFKKLSLLALRALKLEASDYIRRVNKKLRTTFVRKDIWKIK